MGKKETEFYIHKPVTEMELPRMIVCYKEGSYHIIKDICVDETLHSFDTILVENSVKDKEVYNESDFDRDGFTNEHHLLGGLKSFSLNGHPITDVNSEDTENTSSGSLPEECEDMSHTIDETVFDDSHGNFDEVLFPPQEPDNCQCQGQSADVHNENAKLCSLASLLEEDRLNTYLAREMVHASETGQLPIQEMDRGHYQGDLSSSGSTLYRPQLANSDIDQPQSQSVSVDSLESESSQSIGDSGINAVSFDMNSGLPATVINKYGKGASEIQQSGLLTSGSMLEETSSDAPTSSVRTSFGHGHVDTNFLGPASLSGRIAYSGQVPYSGSISLRSDSSTTSTLSFAFPILQSEWNGSPVKMAKADRRYFRKCKGWRCGLFCCRF